MSNFLNNEKLQAILQKPRYVEDGRYDDLSLDYVKYSDVLTITRFVLILGAIIFLILRFFNLFVSSFLPVIVMVILYVLLKLFDKIYVDKENKRLSREAAVMAEGCVVSVVQASDLYGVVVFATERSSIRHQVEPLLEITKKLRDIGNSKASSDPIISHIQKRLWDTTNYFDSEQLSMDITGYNDIWWRVVSVGSSLPENFNLESDVLLGFILNEEQKPDLKLVKSDFYNKYLS